MSLKQQTTFVSVGDASRICMVIGYVNPVNVSKLHMTLIALLVLGSLSRQDMLTSNSCFSPVSMYDSCWSTFVDRGGWTTNPGRCCNAVESLQWQQQHMMQYHTPGIE